MKSKKLILILLLIKSGLILAQTSIFENYSCFKYLAIYEDSINQIYITDTIRLSITDIPWKNQPKKQKTMIWEYRSNIDSGIKSEMYSIGWTSFDSTGFIENEKKIFIHPPRHNQYSFTEIAPFPQIDYPLELNKKYKKFLFVGFGFGEWENLKLVNEYEVIKTESLLILGDEYNCWFINSTSKSELGESNMDFIFSTEIGFIEMDYRFYDHKRIRLSLIGFK